MNDPVYLIVHKDHPVRVRGVNSGAEMATLSLAKFLTQLGKKVVFCAELPDGEDEIGGVSCWDLGPDYDVKGALRRARKLGRYHLISSGRALALLESRGDDLCLSRTLMVHDPSGNSTGINSKVLARVTDNIVCVSQAQKDRCVEAGIPAEKICIVHNGADLELFSPGAADKRNYHRLVFVGALVQDKGIHLLLEAYAKLKGKYKELTLDVYGSAALWGRKPLFDERQVERQLPGVKFHGNVQQPVVAEAFRSAGICVIPSIWFDSFPLTAVEAQVSGCPVVTFDVGGLKEAVSDGKTGVVIPDISADALTAALDKLLASPERLRSMSHEAQRSARSYYNWERVARSVVELCEKGEPEKKDAEISRKKLGFLTTWNQECGLATYAGYLLQHFEKDSYVVLAEDAQDAKRAKDDINVERCWKRGADRFEELRLAVKRHGIGTLHLNCQARFFKQPQFSRFLQELRKEGVKIVAHAHSLFTFEAESRALLSGVDAVIVHTSENKLEAIANGARPEDVHVIPHGVYINHGVRNLTREALRARIGMPLDEKVISAFGFVQAHKGMEGVIESVVHLRRRGVAASGYIIGRPHAEDPSGHEYLRQLKELAHAHGVSANVQFIECFLQAERLSEYLAGSDVVLMNYHSQYFEASGACAVALGTGALVATSIAPPFACFAGAVWHMTAGYPPALAVEALLSNETLRATVLSAAKLYCEENGWDKIAQKFLKVYEQLESSPAASEKEKVVETNTMKKSETRAPSRIKVLMQNRANAFSQRGGDTIVMEKTSEGLKRRGVEAVIDVNGTCDPAGFDLVHLFNFALPDLTRNYAERAAKARVPFVVTTLYEDVPSFHNQSHVVSNRLLDYVQREQPANWYRANKIDITSVERAAKFNNGWTAANAAVLLSSGAAETAMLRRDYSSATKIIEVPFGCEFTEQATADAFVAAHGEKDFILCVGRFESRKNQLMLLKALERSELTVVLASGGFTYQPHYADAVMRFKRKGKTIVLDRLTPEMLASAYCAARVHALPSWYELPGLVSLEAGYYGCNVVASDTGTTWDYLGEDAFFCDPNSEQSIYNAVLAAYYSPRTGNLKAKVAGFNWDNTVEQTLAVYEKIAAKRTVQVDAPQRSFVQPVIPAVPERATVASQAQACFQEILEQGEFAAKKREYEKAHELLGRAAQMNPQSVRALRAQGAVYFAEGSSIKAEEYFDRALKIDAEDPKTLAGKGMCRMSQLQPAAAYPYLIKALNIQPDELVTILQLVECSYQIARYDDLERVLRGYTERHPQDMEMLFCLAGCLFKTDHIEEAGALTERVLEQKPQHLGARQLRDLTLEAKSPKPSISSVAPALPVQPAAAPKPWSLSKPAPAEIVKEGNDPAVQQIVFDNIDQDLVQYEEHKRLKRFSEAREGCEKVLARPGVTAPQREKAELIKAEVLVLTGELAAAEELYDDVLKRNPSSARAICGKGALAANRNEWDNAKSQFERAHSIDVGYDVALAGIGLCAYFRRDNETAWAYFCKAVDSNPENTRAILGIIELGYINKRFQKVEQVLSTYLEMHPGDLNFLYALAGCCFVQDKYDEALNLIHRITLFEPQHKNALDLKRMVEEKRASISVAAHQ